jgi:hypothetical protein
MEVNYASYYGLDVGLGEVNWLLIRSCDIVEMLTK